MPELLDLVDDEHQAALRASPTWDLADLPAARRTVDEMLRAMAASVPTTPGVETRDRLVTASGRAPSVRVRQYRPRNAKGALPTLVWMHGGGFAMGQVAMDDPFCEHVVDLTGCMVISVDYRLAP